MNMCCLRTVHFFYEKSLTQMRHLQLNTVAFFVQIKSAICIAPQKHPSQKLLKY